MKMLFTITTFCFSAITPLMSQVSTPAPADTTSTKEVKKLTANDITLETMDHVKNMFATTATATDVKKATTAAATVNVITEKIIALQAALQATPMPTVEEKKAFAQKMLQYEPKVSAIIKHMTKTFDTNTEEVNKIIQPAVTSFQAKIKPMTNLINTYYPEEEMQGYMNKLKGK